MNNLKYLRKKSNINLRDLGEMTGISFTSLSHLEREERAFREKHINALTFFFACTSDFLLGKTDYGIYVETSHGFTAISKADYESYLFNKELREVVISKEIHRQPSKALEIKLDPLLNKTLIDEINERLVKLSKEDLTKILSFITTFFT